MTRTVQTDLIAAVNREAWMADALCAGDPEPDLWFGGKEQPGETSSKAMKRIMAAHARAKALCADCPVSQACFDRAMGNEQDGREHYGIYGGVDFGGTNKSRRDLAKKRRAFIRAHTRITWETRKAAREAWDEVAAS